MVCSPSGRRAGWPDGGQVTGGHTATRPGMNSSGSRRASCRAGRSACPASRSLGRPDGAGPPGRWVVTTHILSEQQAASTCLYWANDRARSGAGGVLRQHALVWCGHWPVGGTEPWRSCCRAKQPVPCGNARGGSIRHAPGQRPVTLPTPGIAPVSAQVTGLHGVGPTVRQRRRRAPAKSGAGPGSPAGRPFRRRRPSTIRRYASTLARASAISGAGMYRRRRIHLW
jgi:hypothetical protein